MMSAGDLWTIPGNRKAIELDGSDADRLRVAVIDPSWPWLRPAQVIARVLCERAPMRYYGGSVS
jgi:hypothetical protein